MSVREESDSRGTKQGLIVLATCSGVCNVGELTTQADMHLIR
ncbi:hypothetical protein [Methanospirillum sp.]|nr:hypothetical protein [Methanospirillum sp.]